MREKECCLWLIKALTPLALSFSLPPLGLLIWMGITFGKVIKGMGVVRSVENVNTKGGDLPIQEVIVDCGQLLEGADDGVCNFFKDGEVYPDWPVDLDTKLENISWWVTTVDAIKAIGNEPFKKQDYKMALRKYRKVLWYVDICCELEEIDEGLQVEIRRPRRSIVGHRLCIA
ncbi:peptidyl-prolyl cis-trans isomerase CYP40-like isoform X2 [Pyrus communis]|uniref:peptidyl-prolyl cis-trans isomerase CYP40-like isoform X2 n=1 Tax=Pyrus communis TaxID=23211 RepID=UPI0035BF6DA5